MTDLTPLLKLSLAAQRLEAAVAHLHAARNPFEYGPALASVREAKLLIEGVSREMQLQCPVCFAAGEVCDQCVLLLAQKTGMLAF